jgi:hypothetical protein
VPFWQNEIPLKNSVKSTVCMHPKKRCNFSQPHPEERPQGASRRMDARHAKSGLPDFATSRCRNRQQSISITRGHPSRRAHPSTSAQERAPQDEVRIASRYHSSTICPPSYPHVIRPSAARNASVSMAAEKSWLAPRREPMRARPNSSAMRSRSR